MATTVKHVLTALKRRNLLYEAEALSVEVSVTSLPGRKVNVRICSDVLGSVSYTCDSRAQAVEVVENCIRRESLLNVLGDGIKEIIFCPKHRMQRVCPDCAKEEKVN